jgi:hypothetical protein
MNGMHLLPVYYSTTNTRKRKQNKKSASVLEAERQHAKFLNKMGIGTRSSAGLEQRPSKPWVTGSSPVECAKLESCKPTYNSSMAKKPENVYTGTEIIGIAQMHKSNAVPIRGKKQAIEIARMRRG